MKIVVIGTGNVAWHIIRKLSENTQTTVFVHGRNTASLEHLQQEFPSIRLVAADSIMITQADLILICVKDDVLNTVFQTFLYPPHAVVAHTSGSQFFQETSHHPLTGVLYPLQSFSKQIPLQWEKTPLLLEAVSEHAYTILEKAAHLLQAPSFEINQHQRFRIHMAAVITSNFTNHLIGKASELLEQDQIDYHILQPLMEEIIRKAFVSHPADVQTGPAIRNDQTVLHKHVQELQNDPLLQKIYTDISESIQKNR